MSIAKKIKQGLFSADWIAALCIVSMNFNCQQGEKKPADDTTVSTDIDSLRAWVEIPEGCRAAWFVRAMGAQGARSAPGPTDYALYALVKCMPPDWAARLKGECAPVELDEAALPVDTACAKLLGILDANRKSVAGDNVYLKGMAVDIEKIARHPFSHGVGLIMDSTLLVIANTQ